MDRIDCLVVHRPLNCPILVHNLDKFNTITGHAKTAQQQLIHIMNKLSNNAFTWFASQIQFSPVVTFCFESLTMVTPFLMHENEINGLVRNCSKSIANALGLLCSLAPSHWDNGYFSWIQCVMYIVPLSLLWLAGVRLGMGPANERHRYNVTSLNAWAHI